MQVTRPALVWWILIVPSMALLGVLAVSPEFTAHWQDLSRLPLSQAVYQWIWTLAVLAHVGEATYAWSLAGRSAEAPRRAGWALQTLLLGYPSLRLLLARDAGHRTTRGGSR